MNDPYSHKISSELASDLSSAAEASPNAPLTVIFPAQFDSLDKIREFVAQQAEVCGLGPSAVYSVQLAADEAFSNIIEHAYGGECQEDIECRCLKTENGLSIMLIDCGKPFNPDEIPDPDLSADLEHRQVGGLGLYFIRQLMDEVVFSFIHNFKGREGCNVLRMVKYKEKAT
jgi:serine/threonine-protein kinase RsbW